MRADTTTATSTIGSASASDETQREEFARIAVLQTAAVKGVPAARLLHSRLLVLLQDGGMKASGVEIASVSLDFVNFKIEFH